MEFCFYPRHEYACPQIGHCPHLGGAALGTLVHAASDQGQYLDMLHGQLDAERQRNTELFEENQKLRKELDQVRLELKLERQRKFACGRDAKDGASGGAPPADGQEKTTRKRGAPVGHPGHPGWFRPTPTEYDDLVLVAAPDKCPHCTGEIRSFPKCDPHDHLQEDVVDHKHQVVLFRHTAGRCRDCRRWVRQAGKAKSDTHTRPGQSHRAKSDTHTLRAAPRQFVPRGGPA